MKKGGVAKYSPKVFLTKRVSSIVDLSLVRARKSGSGPAEQQNPVSFLGYAEKLGSGSAVRVLYSLGKQQALYNGHLTAIKHPDG